MGLCMSSGEAARAHTAAVRARGLGALGEATSETVSALGAATTTTIASRQGSSLSHSSSVEGEEDSGEGLDAAMCVSASELERASRLIFQRLNALCPLPSPPSPAPPPPAQSPPPALQRSASSVASEDTEVEVIAHRGSYSEITPAVENAANSVRLRTPLPPLVSIHESR